MQSDVLIGTLVGLVAGFLLGAFAALRLDDWLKNKPRRIRCDLGAPVEPAMRRATRPPQARLVVMRSSACCVSYCTSPRVPPSMLCQSHTDSIRAAARRFPGHPNGGTAVTT